MNFIYKVIYTSRQTDSIYDERLILQEEEAKHVFGVSKQFTRRLIVGHFNQEGLYQLMKTSVVKTTYN